MKNLTFVRFIIVGIINTIVGMSVMFILYNLFDCSYWLSSAANYIVGSIVSYVLNRSFTFHSHERQWKSILKFAINIVICYLLAYGVAKPIVYYLMSNYAVRTQGNVALMVGSIIFVLLNYFGQKKFVFKKSRDD